MKSLKGLVIALCGLVLMTACKKDIAVSSISVDPNTLALKVGGSYTLSVNVQPGDATNRNVLWSTSDEKVATVDATGKVTAVKDGSATITATTEDGAKSATCAVTVSTPVTGVTLNATDTTISVGAKITLKATVTPADATNKKVTWSSSDPSVAAVDTSGKVTAVKAGKATITVTTVDGGKTDSCIVTVPIYLPGEFSVSADKKVYFSPGNLYWDGTAFKFEANQYDYRTYAGKNSCIGGIVSATGTPKDNWGLFGWSTTATSNNWGMHIQTATSEAYTGGDFKDWGVVYCQSKGITPDTTWRTLKKTEWQYLLSTRKVTVKGTEETSYGEGKVYGVNGLIILPDNWNGDVCKDFTYGASEDWPNVFSSTTTPTWEAMESAGCVFLPAAGDRYGSDVYFVGDYGYYWSSTASDADDAYFLYFVSGSVSPADDLSRDFGCSVRLVSVAQ